MTSAPEEAARPATADDLPQIIALAGQLRDDMTAQRGGPLWAAHDALAPLTVTALTVHATDPMLATLVGTLDGHVLAYGLAHLEPITRGEGTLGVIDELFVDEPARAVGLGETLLAALVTWCRESGCTGIDATALPGDRQAKNFFEAAGFKARRLVMHTDL
ncbi:MAG: GNAT family N-acetyltransferase [Acidimicrobiia bacterium]